MSVYVDALKDYPGGRGQWCHMATDGGLEELHAFAALIGLKREWFQDHPRVPHYDLRRSKRSCALKHGAIAIETLDLVRRCRIDNNGGKGP